MFGCVQLCWLKLFALLLYSRRRRSPVTFLISAALTHLIVRFLLFANVISWQSFFVSLYDLTQSLFPCLAHRTAAICSEYVI